MYDQKRLICSRVNKVTGELNSCIDYLYSMPCEYSRHMILCKLKCKFSELQFLCNMMCAESCELHGSDSQQSLNAQRTFSLEELAQYNGKDGNPAYVAVNGTVYDVTNNATWAAATHFGLSAGKDLTNEFTSCHAGQQILSKLRIVGKLIS